MEDSSELHVYETMVTYLDPGLHEVEPESQRLPHEDVWVVTVLESSF